MALRSLGQEQRQRLGIDPSQHQAVDHAEAALVLEHRLQAAAGFSLALLPKLGVVGSSPILNVEPVAALAMAWLLLGQSVSPVQALGALLVVGTVMVLGLRRR